MTYSHNPNWNSATRSIVQDYADNADFFRWYWDGRFRAREAVEKYLRGEEELLESDTAPSTNRLLAAALDSVDWDFVGPYLAGCYDEWREREDCTCGEFRSKKCSVHGDLRHVDPDAARDRMQEREIL